MIREYNDKRMQLMRKFRMNANEFYNKLLLFSREPRLYKRVCPSVRPSVGPSVRPSVRNLFFWRAETSRRTTYFVYTNLFYEILEASSDKPAVVDQAEGMMAMPMV